MTDVHAQRTLVKSPPELWAELSDVQALARHLGEFGEIRITRTEPEQTVVWEGDHATGTVELEPSGWGTRVTLTAVPTPDGPHETGVAGQSSHGDGASMSEIPEPPPASPPEPSPTASPDPPPPVAPPKAERRLSRLLRRWRRRPEPPPQPLVPPPALGVAAHEAALEPEAPSVPRTAGEPDPPPDCEPSDREPPDAAAQAHATTVLAGVLDDLGSAHHRPFSRP